MLNNGKDIEEVSNYHQNETKYLERFLYDEDSVKFLQNLGVVTPFEALVICKINMQETQLKNELQNNQEHFMQKLTHVDIIASSGITEIIAKNLDVDLHPAWFDYNPTSCIQHVRNQLQANRDVSSDILFLYMQALITDKNPNEITSIRQLSTDSPNRPIINRRLPEVEKENANALAASVAAKIPFIIHKYPGWQICMKDINGNIVDCGSVNFSFNSNIISDIIFNISNADTSRSIIHFIGNQVSADRGNNEGFKSISQALTTLDLKAEAFYPTVHQGTLLSATEALRNSQHDRAESLENTDNKQPEHSNLGLSKGEVYGIKKRL